MHKGCNGLYSRAYSSRRITKRQNCLTFLLMCCGLLAGMQHSQGYGYLEDRRPSANVDPYNVARLLIKSVINN